MRVVSIGDLVLDYYYNKGKIQGVDGGMSSHNIIANLSIMGMKTSVIASCGDDIMGDIAIKSLDNLNVDTSLVKKIPGFNTRRFHINRLEDGFTSKKKCPICSTKHWYDNTLVDYDDVINNLEEEDVIVIDNLNEINRKIVKNCNQRIMLDLGQYFEFEEYSDKEILDIFKKKFEILNINKRVDDYFKKRFNKKIYNAKLVIITKGSNGADFIYNNKEYNMKLKPAKEIDSNGAGDAFFASIIFDYLNSNKFNVEEAFNNATKLTSKVVSCIGARGHLHSLTQIKKSKKACYCTNFENRKRISRCSLNVNNLETRILNALKTKAAKKVLDIPFETMNSILFTGTGGSYASALFASRIVNDLYGVNTSALYPRDLLYQNISKVDKVVLFSYSGTTDDLLQGTQNFDLNNKIIITKGNTDKVNKKTEVSKKNIISYYSSKSKGKDKGFLSFEGTIVPATLFFQLKCKNTSEFVSESISYWKKYFDNYFSNNKELLDKIFKKGNILNVFYGDYGSSCARDFESKIIESGIFNLILHEKKNFSHGRFINYENLNNNFNIYIKEKNTSAYEKKLIEYLENGNTIILESRYNDIEAEYDLLLMSQYFIYYLSKYLDIDMSKPKYSENAMKIYFYKGQL